MQNVPGQTLSVRNSDPLAGNAIRLCDEQLRLRCERIKVFYCDYLENFNKAGNQTILTSALGIDQRGRVFYRRTERPGYNSHMPIVLGRDRVYDSDAETLSNKGTGD